MGQAANDWPFSSAMGTAPTVLIGLVGDSISKTRTPAMHEAEGAAQGIRTVYRLIDTKAYGSADADLEAILSVAQMAGFAGLNITFPHKQRILNHVDECADEVARVGACNTVVFSDSQRIAHNTDYLGFAHAFGIELGAQPRRSVLLAGAGGAGSAVAHALLENRIERLFIFDREIKLAEHLARSIREHHQGAQVEVLTSLESPQLQFEGIVNATPMGMAEHPGMAVPNSLLQSRPWVADIVYFPLETELLRTARKHGCKTMTGSGMAVMQAAKAFELFTGLTAEADRMRKTFDGLGSGT